MEKSITKEDEIVRAKNTILPLVKKVEFVEVGVGGNALEGILR